MVVLLSFLSEEFSYSMMHVTDSPSPRKVLELFDLVFSGKQSIGYVWTRGFVERLYIVEYYFIFKEAVAGRMNHWDSGMVIPQARALNMHRTWSTELYGSFVPLEYWHWHLIVESNSFDFTYTV